jgi:hypothetical protein
MKELLMRPTNKSSVEMDSSMPRSEAMEVDTPLLHIEGANDGAMDEAKRDTDLDASATLEGDAVYTQSLFGSKPSATQPTQQSDQTKELDEPASSSPPPGQIHLHIEQNQDRDVDEDQDQEGPPESQPQSSEDAVFKLMTPLERARSARLRSMSEYR